MLNILPKVAIYFQLKRYTQSGLSLLYTFQQLPILNEFWIEFRTGKTREFIPFHEISKTFYHQYVMDNYFFMPLAVAIPHIHIVEKVKVVF